MSKRARIMLLMRREYKTIEKTMSSFNKILKKLRLTKTKTNK
jgi:hypothetical protein